MKIKFECKVSKMSIEFENVQSTRTMAKNIEVSLVHETTICNMSKYIAWNIDKDQPYYISSKTIFINKAEPYFDFMSIHSRETFVITAEQVSNTNEGCNANINGASYEIISVELIYG